MNALLDKRLIMVGGPGGVGKTTLAASLALRLARSGKKTLVLTVDPAKRLAQALGFVTFEKEIQQVTAAEGSLFASMLDTQRYFDRIITRLARSPEQREKILTNPIYQTMVARLGGTHEYAAMERLYEFAKDPQWEHVVVDTPPTQNAVDLLSAPQRLADFMDNSVLRWFQGGDQPSYLKWFKQGTKLAMKVLQKVFGAEFLTEFTRLMDDLEGMQAGFRKTNLEILDLLKSPQCAFLLVTYPSELRFQESLAFRDTLKEKGITLAQLVLNRIEREVPVLENTPPEISPWLSYERQVSEEQKAWIEHFAKQFASVPLRRIPVQRGPLHAITTLSRLGDLLVD